METTLEVRWYIRGKPPATVQRWFEFECPGKLLGLESRRDWYAYCQPNQLGEFAKFSNRALNREEINLKLRQGNLELKLRQQEFGIHRFSYLPNSHICGKTEQWCKFSQQELKSNLLTGNLLNKFNWISVDKKREQKIERGVKSELTCLKIDKPSSMALLRECWWTIAFEMERNIHPRQQDNCFIEVVEKACQTYCGPELLAVDSCGYSQWLLRFATRSIPAERLDLSDLSVNL